MWRFFGSPFLADSWTSDDPYAPWTTNIILFEALNVILDHLGGFAPPPVSGKKIKKQNKKDLRVMKGILYDMGPLTLVRWLLQRALKFGPPFGPRSKLRRVPPHPEIEKNKCVLNWLLGKIQCFKPLVEFSTIFFLNPSLIGLTFLSPTVACPSHLSTANWKIDFVVFLAKRGSLKLWN